VTAAPVRTEDAKRSAERARATWKALRRLHDRRTDLYHEPSSGLLARLGAKRSPPEHLWPFAGAWAAALAVATLPDRSPAAAAVSGSPTAGLAGSWAPAALGERWRRVLDGHLRGMSAYAPPSTPVLDASAIGPLRLEAGAWPRPGGGGDAYYDDNAWIALNLYAHCEVTGDRSCLPIASRILDFVLSGWSAERDWSHPGGIRWAEPPWSRTRNTCSNAPAAEAALLAHIRHGEAGRLERAMAILGWVDGSLRSPKGLYNDRIDPDGAVTSDLWAYNQGTMIGARVLCFEATDESAHLEQAVATANACATWLGDWPTLERQPPPFLAIFLRNLLLLGAHRDVGSGIAQVARFADWAWEHERHESTGLFRTGELRVNRTAGMASIYALLAGALPQP